MLITMKGETVHSQDQDELQPNNRKTKSTPEKCLLLNKIFKIVSKAYLETGASRMIQALKCMIHQLT
jgi:hypothetical protein